MKAKTAAAQNRILDANARALDVLAVARLVPGSAVDRALEHIAAIQEHARAAASILQESQRTPPSGGAAARVVRIEDYRRAA